MTTIHAKPGEPIQLGVCIGFGMEWTKRWGRLVGIRHDRDSIKKYIIREYKDDDVEFPTGEYHTTSSMFLIPHTGDGCP